MKRTEKKLVPIIVSTALAFNLGVIPATANAATGYPGCDDIDGPLYSLPYVKSDPTQIGEHVDMTLSVYHALGCNGEITSYEWDLGDGNLATGKTVTHSYGVGTFRPILTIKNAAGDVLSSAVNNEVVVKSSNNAPVVTDFEEIVPKKSNFKIDLEEAVSDPDGDEDIWVKNPQVTAGSASIRVVNRDSGTELDVSGVDTSIGSQVIEFTYDAEDDFGGKTTGQATIRIDNAAPVITKSLSYAIDEDTRQYVYLPKENIATDPDGDTLQYRVAYETDHGTVEPGNGAGEFYYYPDANFSGIDAFEVAVSDGHDVSYATATVTVRPINDTPVVPSLDKIVIEEDGAPVTFNPLDKASDIDGDELTVARVDQPDRGGSVVLNPDNTITFTPERNFDYFTVISYVVTDGTVEVEKKVIVEITSVNDAPSIDTFSISEVSKKRAVSFSASASDVENTSLNYEWNFGDGSSKISGMDLKDTSHTYARKGTYTVTLRVTDSNGAVVTQTGVVTVNK